MNTATLSRLWAARRVDHAALEMYQDLHSDGETKVEDELEVGKSYYIRCLNFNYVGKLAAVRHDVLVLTQASWIAEDDRFHVTLSKGTFREIERYPDDARVLINRVIISDICEFAFPLPTVSK